MWLFSLTADEEVLADDPEDMAEEDDCWRSLKNSSSSLPLPRALQDDCGCVEHDGVQPE